MKKKIGFIGAGKMAEALIKGIIEKKLAGKTDIIASDVNEDRLSVMKKLGVRTTDDNKYLMIDVDIIFLSVKPQIIDRVLDDIAETDKLVVSIAAGITIKHIEDKLKKARVIRVMPNTPCLVGEMAAGYSIGKRAKDEDVKLISEILNSNGKAFLLEEKLIDSVTALSGSGPAFVAYLIQAMIDGSKGLSKDVATELAIQTFKGTAKLLQETGMSAEELIKMVTSPGGTTVAGMEVLKNSDIRKVLADTIKAAENRAKELGK